MRVNMGNSIAQTCAGFSTSFRFGSVCSGIEAASVAWEPLGWRAAWLSEIEPFPSAVLAHHYPDVPNMGDMTQLPDRIASGEVEAPDLFCGGTPCQAFSVAGLRKSLDDARGNLSLVFCEIANAIDSARDRLAQPPAIVFWENVPGVLSTKDNAFGCFLAGLAGEDDPIEPPRGKWTNAGVILGPQRAVAWRVLDAQYFGVAQRRRRVFVVASARDDFDPAAVLLEFDSLRRDSAPSRQARQNTPASAGAGASFGGMSPVAGTLTANTGGMTRPAGNANELDFCMPVAKKWPAEIASTLDTTSGTKQGLEDQHVNAGCPLFVPAQPIGFNARQDPDSWQGRTGPLDTDGCTQAVAQPMPINTMVALRHEALGEGTGFGIGEAGDPAYTLTKGHSHAVAQPMVLMDQGGSVMNVEHDMVGTLRRETHGHEPAVIQPPSMAVRRLTPVECERLQGFPDNYTAIPWKTAQEANRKGVSYESLLAERGMTLRGPSIEDCPDGPRYKALGNSWAVPVVRWIGQRIARAVANSASRGAM